ncbi:MBL fold metallo-hydrolase [Paenibacillus aestuarii]|uniref:MBL fold metallo-hydrolase n=1 Tax=Paenibacillus aestuarii TaxID=516965 RepID=A0ABW0KDZ2_9BACL|nr:MBL fold metallo-hydrolase [Paenibacillus aestuarii]
MIQFQNEHMTVFQSVLYQTTATVIQTTDLVLVVDPNWLPSEVEQIRSYVDQIKGARELYLLFTHGDFDHIIGYRAFPDARVIGSKGLSEHPKKAYKLELIRDFDAKHYVERSYSIEFPELDIIMSDNGQQLKKGGTTLTFFQTPGHTADGLFTIVEPLGILIAGDYLSDFELPFIYDSAKAYQQTLLTAKHIFEQYAIKALVPGHGRVTTDLEEMRRRLDLADDHLQRLIQAVTEPNEAAVAALEQEHAFPSSFTQECHAENVRIIQQEFGKRNE